MRCWVCSGDTSDGDYVLIGFIYTIVRVCSTCWERGEEVEIGLDYTEPDPNLEGQPEFNGSFG